MAKHESIGTVGRRAVGEGTNLAVRAADADLDGADLDLGGRADVGHGVLEQGDFSLLRYDSDGFHDWTVV